MRNLDNACGYYQRFYQRPHEDNDPKKPQLYWDGYQWVIRPNNMSNQDLDIIKPGRKVIVSNFPLHLNIQAKEIKEYLTEQIIEKDIVSKKEVKDLDGIITGLELDFEKNCVVLSMETIDLAKRMALLDGIKLLAYTLRFSLYQDIEEEGNSNNANNVNKAKALANSATLSAKSAAIAYAAFHSFTKNDNLELNLNNNTSNAYSTKVIKIMNLHDPKKVDKIPNNKLDETRKDVVYEFRRFGKIISSVIILPETQCLGAEIGSVFIEFQTKSQAEAAKIGTHKRRYQHRDIKTAYFDEEIYKAKILKVIDEPVENKN